MRALVNLTVVHLRLRNVSLEMFIDVEAQAHAAPAIGCPAPSSQPMYDIQHGHAAPCIQYTQTDRLLCKVSHGRRLTIHHTSYIIHHASRSEPPAALILR